MGLGLEGRRPDMNEPRVLYFDGDYAMRRVCVYDEVKGKYHCIVEEQETFVRLEYAALKLAVGLVEDHIGLAIIRGDSKPVIKQMLGVCGVQNAKARRFRWDIRKMMDARKGNTILEWVHKDKNMAAEYLRRRRLAFER